MRAPLIALGLTLTTSPALAAAPGQTLEPLQVSPVRDGRLFSPESSSPLLVPTTEIACGGQPIQPLYADDLALGVSPGFPRRRVPWPVDVPTKPAMRQAPNPARMCTTGPAAVDKPVNIGGRIKFPFADQRVALSTGTRPEMLMSGGEHLRQLGAVKSDGGAFGDSDGQAFSSESDVCDHRTPSR